MEKTSPSQSPLLITGAAGFIGYHLSRALLEAGHTVVGFDNLNDYYDPTLKQARLDLLKPYPTFTFVRGDLADAAAVNALFDQYGFDRVVNLAAQAGVRYSIDNPQAYIQSNIVGFFNILEACRHHKTGHLIYASSSSVYGNQQKTPFSINDDVSRPISLYAATKKSNELMAYTYSHLYGIPTTGLRFFTVYGPLGRPDMAYFKFADKIRRGEPIEIYNHGDLYRDFTYIDDIVTGVVRVLSAPAPEDARIYNIGNSSPENLLHFVEVLETCLGKAAVKQMKPMQPGDVYQTYADASALEKDYGFKPTVPIEEGLAKFAEWYKAYYNMA